MAKKKTKHKSTVDTSDTSASSDSAAQPPKKLLGVDMRDIGAAIATAVVAELTQAALTRLTKGNDQDSDHDSSNGDDASNQQPGVTSFAAADAVKESFTDSAAVQIITNAVKNVFAELKPQIAEAIAGVKAAPSAATEVAEAVPNQAQAVSKQATQTVTNAVQPITETVTETVQNGVEAVKHSVGDSVGNVAANMLGALEPDSTNKDNKSKKKKKNKSKKKKKHKK